MLSAQARSGIMPCMRNGRVSLLHLVVAIGALAAIAYAQSAAARDRLK